MNYEIFLDESGNTGNPRLKNDKWNFNDQPYFALGSLCIREDKRNGLETEIQDILTKYDRDLGRSKELKSTAQYKFKDELLKDIVDKLSNRDVKFYFDISNKKYKIIMNIVECCVYPYYFINSLLNETIRDKKIFAATHLFSKLSDTVLQEFINICVKDIEQNENESYLEMLKFLQVLLDIDIDIDLKNQINHIKKYISSLKEKGLPVKNIYPIQDLTNKNSIMSFLPNIDAFLNIIASTANIRLASKDQLLIFHDEQKQFSQSLIKWVEKMKLELQIPNLQKVSFIESKNSILIQIVDLLTGTILGCFRNSIENPYSRRNREILKILKPIVQNCNTVTIESEYREFFKQVNVKFGKTPLPIN